jgi:hypothetical protein
MGIVFRDTGTTGRAKSPFHEYETIDGKTYVYALAHSTLTTRTSYRVAQDEFGFLTASHGAGNTSRVFRVGANMDGAVTTGNRTRLQIRGYFSSLVTPSLSVAAGHALAITAGVIADVGADFSDKVTEFATCVTATSSLTTCSVQLAGKYITASAI